MKKPAVTPNEQKAELVGILLEVGEIKPCKKRRLKALARKRWDILDATYRPFHGQYFNFAEVQY